MVPATLFQDEFMPTTKVLRLPAVSLWRPNGESVYCDELFFKACSLVVGPEEESHQEVCKTVEQFHSSPRPSRNRNQRIIYNPDGD